MPPTDQIRKFFCWLDNLRIFAHDVLMDEMIQQLLALQDRDQKIRAYRMELEAIPREKAAKERLIAEAAERLEKARTRAKQIEVEKKSLQGEAAAKRELIARYRTQQMQTRKNEEFSALSHEIDNAGKSISQIEDKELVLMEESESLRPQILAAEQTYLSEKSKYESQITALTEKAANLTSRINEIDASRASCLAGVDEDLLERYQRLFNTKHGTAIVPVEHEVCTGCHMKVITQTVVALKAHKDIISCPQCGRILYLAL